MQTHLPIFDVKNEQKKKCEPILGVKKTMLLFLLAFSMKLFNYHNSHGYKLQINRQPSLSNHIIISLD